MSEIKKPLRPRRRRRAPSQPVAGWGLVADAASRLGFGESLGVYAARRAFSIACHRLVPRLEPQARAESLGDEEGGRTLTVRVSSSSVASELLYVKDLLLEQVNAQLKQLAQLVAAGRRARVFRIDRLQYRVGPVKSLPDYAAWMATPRRATSPSVPTQPWNLQVAAELTHVADPETRDALAALYSAATGSSALRRD